MTVVGAVVAQAKDTEPMSELSLAETVTLFESAAVAATVPLMRPVVVFMVKPVGRPVAAQVMRSPSGSVAESWREAAVPRTVDWVVA
jgi:hypothetical protein